jgi:16S rRNA (cytidine1402-2'-O)-methyltransferase
MSAVAPAPLVLMPNALDLGSPAAALTDVLPLGVLQQAAAITHWAVEDARSARAFLKRVAAHAALAAPLQAQHIVELPRPRKGSREPVPAAAWHALLAPALGGHALGLLSEAGLPGVADPGAELVAAAHAAGVPVQPLAGPSAITLALAGSGLNGQSFAFVGYLPQDTTARAQRVRELEALSRRLRQTQVVIETPYRNAALAEALLSTLAPETRLCIACGLTLPGGWTRTLTVATWRHQAPQLPDSVPAVMAWLAG